MLITDNEVREDLKEKYLKLMRDITQRGLERIDSVEAAGCGILQDHREYGMNYVVPFAIVGMHLTLTKPTLWCRHPELLEKYRFLM